MSPDIDADDGATLRLAAHFEVPPVRGRPVGVVLCHGFPSGPWGARSSAATYPELAARLSGHTGWPVLTFNFRGAGNSQGDFSIRGWIADVGAAVDALEARTSVEGVHLVGSSLGGAIALAHAVEDQRVISVATLGTPVGGRWSRDPNGFLDQAREVGVIRSADYPEDRSAWARDLASLDPKQAAADLGGRPLLVLHGSADEVVPTDDARALAEAGGERARLRIVHEAGHQLRSDPRAIAVLLGWLERR